MILGCYTKTKNHIIQVLYVNTLAGCLTIVLFARFVKDGGCSVLNKWLEEGITSQNMPLILDVLEVGVLS